MTAKEFIEKWVTNDSEEFKQDLKSLIEAAIAGFLETPEYKAIPAAESDRDEILECLYDVFYQSCMQSGDKFDNLAISVYESAQDLLIRLGKIKESDCYRK